MIEYNNLLIRLQMLRDDLTGEVVISEIEKLAAASTISTTHHLRACVRLAMKNQPMPWEKQTKRQRLISALREKLDVTEEMVSDDKILLETTGTLIRKGIELDFAFKDLSQVFKESIPSVFYLEKVFGKLKRKKQ